MTGIFGPKPTGYVAIPLLAGEQIVRQQPASYLVNGKAMWGGQLVLTNQRLLFQPLDMGAVTKLISEGIDFLPDNLAILGKVVSKALDYTSTYQGKLTSAINSSSIVGVVAGMNASLGHPPSLILTFDNGRRLELGILNSIKSPNFLPANNAARDAMVAAIRAQETVSTLNS